MFHYISLTLQFFSIFAPDKGQGNPVPCLLQAGIQELSPQP